MWKVGNGNDLIRTECFNIRFSMVTLLGEIQCDADTMLLRIMHFIRNNKKTRYI